MSANEYKIFLNEDMCFFAENNEEIKNFNIYFIIGIGRYIRDDDWPQLHLIWFDFGLKIGRSGFKLIFFENNEEIDFIEGDIFIGFYPFWEPVNGGFVCGLWLDKR